VPVPSELPPAFLGLRPGDQLFVGVMLVVSLILMVAQWVRLSGWGLREVEIQRQPARVLEYRIDINTATWVEWSQLEGIGETLAMRIVADRDQHGPFQSIDDLLRVPGIGPKKLESMRPWLSCEPTAK
jgi:competence protein ComEA